MAFSEQFIDEQTAHDEFKRILTSLPGYERLTDSQIVEGISLFQSWSLRQANWRAERAHQEGFLSTASNRSSVLAHSEGRQYVPRKPTPSRGSVALTNKGSKPVSFPAGSTFLGANQLPYQLTDDAVVPAGAVAIFEVCQWEDARYSFTVEETRPFYEITLDRSDSVQVGQLEVRVSGEVWKMHPRLMNTNGTSRAYDEFYSPLDEIGIRFGNGTFGRMPKGGDSVVIYAKVTRGETELLAGQELRYLSGSLDTNVGLVEASTYTPIVGGKPQEDIEEIRRNALYYPLYDEQLTWRDDYAFQIRRQWPEVVWVNVWGEQEQEQASGMSLDNIGKIFISAYAPERPGLLEEITTHLEEPISREYQAVEPNPKPFMVRLKGRIVRSLPKERIENEVRKLLERYYGKDSRDRRTSVKLKDFYRLLNATGYFEEGENEEGDFIIELFGDTSSNGLDDLPYLDWQLSDINVGYEQWDG
ncbi:hypothetical protein [Vreelandella alkaliphila]|uniref:Baseplate protein J-like domain-containing protein n=1 Tax=Vreelandella alkaliphila TaxID=272774 RepID=A0AAJ2RX52_9GAMM|nr:hypothetical protein [Halomonas alkaliphila]MDX5979547.1 hypothetical protein [Halomonas alkaliphila]